MLQYTDHGGSCCGGSPFQSGRPVGRLFAAAAEVFVPADVRQNEPVRMLRISVSDSGVGMDDATLRRAIEPFFSTKMPGRGSGLGLPIVRAIVKQSGGHFSIQSKPGCGTTVDMWLPVAEEGGAIGVAA